MAQAEKKDRNILTPEEIKAHELYTSSCYALEKIGMAKSTIEKLSEAEVNAMAKSLMAERERLHICKQQENAKHDGKRFEKEKRPDFENLAKDLFDVFKSEIGDSPTKSFSESIQTNNGTIIAGITAYQDTDRPDVKAKREAKQKIQTVLRNIVETFGVKVAERMLVVKKGTKDRFTYGVFDKKHKIKDLEFQFTLGYEVKKPEEE